MELLPYSTRKTMLEIRSGATDSKLVALVSEMKAEELGAVQVSLLFRVETGIAETNEWSMTIECECTELREKFYIWLVVVIAGGGGGGGRRRPKTKTRDVKKTNRNQVIILFIFFQFN